MVLGKIWASSLQDLTGGSLHSSRHLGGGLEEMDWIGQVALPAPGVGSQAVVPAPLDVEADQVEAELLMVLLEQVLRQLGGQVRVHLLKKVILVFQSSTYLGLLRRQTSGKVLKGQVVVQIVGSKLSFPEVNRLCLWRRI